jgi:myo-inositol-1(or 4)-monophosphatase
MTTPTAPRKPADDSSGPSGEQAAAQLPSLDSLSELLRAAAAAEIMPRFRRTAFRDKADGSLVTDADLAMQQRVAETLAARWPEIPLLGEEMEAEHRARLFAATATGTDRAGRGSTEDAPSGTQQGAFWCLDPLDGTSNFTCGFPGFGVSLALVRGGRVELGVVFDPLRDECFAARRGGGAWCNGEPIAPFAPGAALKDCIAIIDLKRLPVSRLGSLLAPGSFRSQRNLGAVALEWCWLAAGRFQLYLHGGQSLWDYAAGELIAAEAGVATALFAPDGIEPVEFVTLDKRVAVAAATPDLMALWQGVIHLPLKA